MVKDGFEGILHARVISRDAVNPSLEALGSTSCLTQP